MKSWSQEDIGQANRQRILKEVLGAGSTSRSIIGERLDLNAASVSRITRDLIEAGLVQEVNADEPTGRRGPRSKKLVINHNGGYIIGIGINAYQQVVTLADLSNERIASWDATDVELADAEQFLKTCCDKANELIDQHVPDRSRVFGVGLTVSGELNKARGSVLFAPTLGWNAEVDATAILTRELKMPVVLETPSAAICQSEAAFGVARGASSVGTLYCALGFGFGLQINNQSYANTNQIGGILTEAKIVDQVTSSTVSSLSELCGGRALLRETLGEAAFGEMSDQERARHIYEIVSPDAQITDAQRQGLHDIGLRSANAFALCLTVLQPDVLLLAGPLAQSPHYFDAFRDQLAALRPERRQSIEIRRSDLTQMGAARLLSLSENIGNANLDLTALKGGT